MYYLLDEISHHTYIQSNSMDTVYQLMLEIVRIVKQTMYCMICNLLKQIMNITWWYPEM